MKLKYNQILSLRHLLSFLDETSPDGKFVQRTFTVKEFSAYKWFFKNTKEIIEEYNKLLEPKKKELQKKYKKELDLQTKAINNLKLLSAQLKEQKSNDADIIEATKKIINEENFKGKIDSELNKDEELITAYQVTEYEVDVRPNTIELFKTILQDRKLTANDFVIEDVIEQLFE